MAARSGFRLSRALAALLALGAPAAAAVDLFGDVEQEFLHPDQAFVLSVMAEAPNRLQARFEVAEGYYLYRDKTAFAVPEPAALQYVLPPGEPKDDPLFGAVETYPAAIAVALRLAGLPRDAETVMLEARYQGCAEKGVCYPPQVRTLRVALAGAAAGAPVAVAPGGGGPELSEFDRIARDLELRSLGLNFLAFIGFGLLLALTPCVLPMLPILASVIAGAHAGTRRAVALSLAYVLAMSTAYALLGFGVGLTGANLQPYLQNAWVIVPFVGVLVLLALAMFGVYELQLPQAVRAGFDRLQRRTRGGSYIGAATMGLLAALVAAPCVSPALVGALVHIADTGSAARGAVSLFGMGLGLGLPLLAVGAFEGRFLPRSGPWMVRVRAFFGVLLLLLAVWMLDRVVPGPVTLALAGLVLIGTGMALRAVDALPADAGMAARLGKGAGFALLVYGAVLTVGGAMGSGSVLQPLSGQAAPRVAEIADFRPIKTVADLERELRAAAGRPVLVDFYADWCVTCRELEAFTFPDPEVRARMESFVLLRADVTANDAADRALLGHLGLFGPPAILLYAADGEELRGLRTVSYLPPQRFTALLDDALDLN